MIMEMTKEEIYSRVVEIIEESPYCTEDVENEHDELYELGFDSLSVLELGEDIQDEFNLEGDFDINKYSTPKQIAVEVWRVTKD